MFRFQFRQSDLAAFVEWITLNRAGLSVMLHAITGDDIHDHEHNAMWLGKPLPLDIDALRRFQDRIRKGELPQTLMPATQARAAIAGKVRYRPGDDSVGPTETETKPGHS
jgi:DOPA 4,5-dioxygenase